MAYPTNIENLTNPASGDALNSPSHADQHINSNDIIEALEAKVGVNSSAVATSHDYKIDVLEGKTANLSGTNTGDEDTASITALGALMDSEITNLAEIKAFSSADYATSAQGSTADSALQDIADDTTPALGGELDANDNNIKGAGAVSFTQELDNGSKTANFSIDFSTDQKQRVELTDNTITLTLDTTDIGVGNYQLKVVNGGLATLTWASETGVIKWAGGTPPTLTSAGTDFIAVYYDNQDFYLQSSLNYS